MLSRCAADWGNEKQGNVLGDGPPKTVSRNWLFK
jgi:hypothetical protein